MNRDLETVNRERGRGTEMENAVKITGHGSLVSSSTMNVRVCVCVCARADRHKRATKEEGKRHEGRNNPAEQPT